MEIKKINQNLAKLDNLKTLKFRSSGDIFSISNSDYYDSDSETENPSNGIPKLEKLEILHLYCPLIEELTPKIAALFPNIKELLVNERAMICNCESWIYQTLRAGLCKDCKLNLENNLKENFSKLQRPIIVDLGFMVPEQYFRDSEDDDDFSD